MVRGSLPSPKCPLVSVLPCWALSPGPWNRKPLLKSFLRVVNCPSLARYCSTPGTTFGKVTGRPGWLGHPIFSVPWWQAWDSVQQQNFLVSYWATIYWVLLWIRKWGLFICFFSFNPHNQLRVVVLLFSSDRWRSWGSESGSDLPKVTLKQCSCLHSSCSEVIYLSSLLFLIWPPAQMERAFLVARRKDLPAMQKQPQETWVRSLGWEDPLEEEMATHSSILAWRVPRMEESGGLQSTGSQRVRHDWSDSARMYAQIGISGLSRNFPPTRIWKQAHHPHESGGEEQAPRGSDLWLNCICVFKSQV